MKNAEIWAQGRASGIPDQAIEAFLLHRCGARRREIEFLFSLHEWWEWWNTDERWEQRGRGAKRLVMARSGDTGPYHPSNVYCATGRQNIKDGARPRKGKPPKEPKSAGSAELGDRIRVLRQEAGMSQRRLAAAAGMQQERISAIETGVANPTIGTLTAIAQALGLKMDLVFSRITS